MEEGSRRILVVASRKFVSSKLGAGALRPHSLMEVAHRTSCRCSASFPSLLYKKLFHRCTSALSKMFVQNCLVNPKNSIPRVLTTAAFVSAKVIPELADSLMNCCNFKISEISPIDEIHSNMCYSFCPKSSSLLCFYPNLC